MLTSPLFVSLRTITRKLGINRLAGSLISNTRYEDRFGPALQANISAGDVVWDIGANVGLYTSSFMEATGPEGCVVAFEPTAACFDRLRERFVQAPRVVLKNVALGDADGTTWMAVDADPLAATHRIVGSGGGPADARSVAVQVKAAASIVHAEPSLFPNVVKIDVEGHEGAVLDGFVALLADRRLRCIGIEMHFGLLAARGESDRPRRIEQLLIRNGFKLRWTDPSHLLATR